MERMERHLAASTLAPVASPAHHHARPGKGKFHFSFLFELFEISRPSFFSMDFRALPLSPH
jgi:hypothetical protein